MEGREEPSDEKPNAVMERHSGNADCHVLVSDDFFDRVSATYSAIVRRAYEIFERMASPSARIETLVEG
jgi:hypothetical protein